MLRCVLIGLAVASMGTAATAATGLDFTSASIGTLQQVEFNGFTDSFAGGTAALPGLSARLGFKLESIVGNQWSFAYSVANTSIAPVTSSRVSVFGFNPSQVLRTTTAIGEFSSISSGIVPVGRGSRAVCFRTGNGGECAGGGNGGVTIGEAASTGVFKLIFAAPTTSVILNDLFVRYQSLNVPSRRILGASGVGDVAVGGVPEPTTWGMLIIGFATIGEAMRRNRGVAAD